jgi:site-specific recombinase XerD
VARGDYPAEPLSKSEVSALLAACDATSLTGQRFRALLVVMWRCGLRCSEALALRPVDVDFERGTVRVRFGKGRKARVVGLDDDGLVEVRAWVGARELAGLGAAQWLFCSIVRNSGGRMSARYVRAQTARLAARAGISHRVHPHALRHTCAVELTEEGWPVPDISRQLGHESLNTTQVYVDHLLPVGIVSRARGRSWA